MKTMCIGLFALILPVFLNVAPAHGQQSQSDLRRENQRLQAEVDDLTRELEAAMKEIKDLKAALESLRKELAEARAGGRKPSPPPLEEERVSIDESKPGASPRALLRTIKESYEKTMSAMEMGDDDDDIERRSYMRELERWQARTNREFRMPIEWTVRVTDEPARPAPAGPSGGRGFLITVQAVDPVTDAKLGDLFQVFLTPVVAARLREVEQRDGLEGVFVLRGTLVPQVRINENRAVRGPFDNPPFIGPFAEFYFGVEAQSLAPKPVEKKTNPPATSPPPAPVENDPNK